MKNQAKNQTAKEPRQRQHLREMNSQHNKNKAKRLSIVHLVYRMGLGGIEISTAKLALDQKTRGCEVAVVCLFNDGCIGEELAAKGIEVITLNLRRGRGLMNLIRPLNRICEKRKTEVLHVHAVGVEIPVGIVILLRRIKKSILTIRGFENRHGWRKWRGLLCAKVAGWCFSNTVIISHALKEHEIRDLHRRADKLSVIWNGVDTKIFCPALVEPNERADALGLNSVDPHAFVVGMGAQLKEFKDIPTLIRAAARIKDQKHKDIVFVVAGVGPLETELKVLVAKLGIEDSFKFVGRIKDMPRFLNAIDLLALTSPYEGLSVVILEAMATAKPVVTTDSGGIRDSVVDGETGIIVPVGDDKTLAEATVKLFHNRQLAHKMGQAGLRRARRHFTIEQYTQSYWDLITKRNT